MASKKPSGRRKKAPGAGASKSKAAAREVPRKSAKKPKGKPRQRTGENTPAKTPERPGAANLGPAWKKGQSGNPAGRPKGSRNKLCKQYIEDLYEVWLEATEAGCGTGILALRVLAQKDPEALVKRVGALVPREFDLGGKTQRGFKELWTALATGKVPDVRSEEDEEDDA